MLFALDFFFYSFAAAVAALIVSRGNRILEARRFLVGVLISSSAIAIVFAAIGILPGFLYYSFVFIPRLWPAYALGAPPAPADILNHLQSVEAVISLFDPAALYYWFLLAAVLLTASLLVRAPAVGMRGRALLPLLVWFCAATLSVLERHHFGYALFVAPIAMLLLARWLKGYAAWRTTRGVLAIAVIGIAALAPRPDNVIPSIVYGLSNSHPPDTTQTVSDPPRARGVFFPREDVTAIVATGEFLKSGLLAPDETWLDFSNASILYYLFNRDCPIRYYEVAYYETRKAQEEVIGAVAHNMRVKAVLMRTGRPSDWVDGVPNTSRAPLVFDYISKEFEPAFSNNGVEFWVRRPRGPSPVR
jgi:hypothetical protein